MSTPLEYADATAAALTAAQQTVVRMGGNHPVLVGHLNAAQTSNNQVIAALAQPQPLGVPGNWKLVFDDEFSGNELDTSKWTDHNGWKNQNNVTDNSANVIVNNGLTLILASNGSGAAIETTGFTLPVGGVTEARVNFAGNGTTIYNWPAWWTSGPNWPAAGENDIAEGLGTLTVNYHSPSGAHNQGTIPGIWSNAFHTYGIHRNTSTCDVRWDGQLVKSYNTDDDGAGQNLILTIGQSNQVVYGAAGAMHVNFVRAWVPA